MKTGELIQYVASDLLDDRTDMLEGMPDEVHSDKKIARFLAEAEQIMCRRAFVLDDVGESVATRITLAEGKGEYAVHPSIIHVKAVRLSDSDVDLLRTGYDDNRVRGVFDVSCDTGYWDVNVPYMENPGRPSRYSLDMGTHTIRVRRQPDADAAQLKLVLAAVRMPFHPISSLRLDSAPEIPEQYHMNLADYAAGKCLMSPTLDAESRSLGRQMVNDFYAAVQVAKLDRHIFTQSEPRYRFGGWVSGQRYGW